MGINWGAKAGFSQKRTKRTEEKISGQKATVYIFILKVKDGAELCQQTGEECGVQKFKRIRSGWWQVPRPGSGTDR